MIKCSEKKKRGMRIDRECATVISKTEIHEIVRETYFSIPQPNSQLHRLNGRTASEQAKLRDNKHYYFESQ